MGEFDAVVENYRQANPNDVDLNEIFKVLVQQFGLTSFQSLSTDRDYLRQQRLSREFKLLQTFNQIDQQLFLLRDPIDDLSKEHLPFLTNAVSDLHPKPKSLAQEILTFYFYKKSFKMCEELENIYHLSWFDKTNSFMFPYGVENVRGMFRVNSEELSLSPLYCLLGVAPTQDHLDYLKTKGVAQEHLSNILSFIEATRDFLTHNSPYFLGDWEKQSCLTTLSLAESLCIKETLQGKMPIKPPSLSRKI